MPGKSLVELAIESRAREQCEDDLFFRSTKGPQKVKKICIKCLKEETETVHGKICRECKLKNQRTYNVTAPSRMNRLKYKGLLKRYVKGEL